MKRKVSVFFATAALALGLGSAALAAVPSTIPYQGRLTDAAGVPINGSQSIRFSLQNALTAGAELWFEVQPTVTVTNGLFNVDLGSVTAIPASVFSGGDLFLEIKVGSDAAMTPRQRIGSVAYAFRSGLAPGIATAVAAGQTVAAGVQNLTSITATFPTSGFAFVLANVEAYVSIPAATTNCLGMTINDVSATNPGSENFQCIQNPSGGTVFHEGNSTNTRTFAVTAGAKTFFLIGDGQSGAWSTWRSKLTVMFFPDAVGANNLGVEPQPEPSRSNRVGNTDR